MHITKEKLKNILIKSGVVTDDIYESADDESKRLGQNIGDVLIGNGNLTEEFFLELLEPYYGVPSIQLKETVIAPDILTKVPEAYAQNKNAVLFDIDKEKGIAKVAMTDPFDYETIEFLRAKLGLWVEPYLTTPTSIRHGLKLYENRIGAEFNDIISENAQKLIAIAGESEASKLAQELPVVMILDSIISHAISLNASDIHFEPFEKNFLVRYRVDGILQEVLNMHKVIENVLVARVKILANLQIDEHRVPQDGRFRFDIDEGSMIDVRVNVIPVMHGEKVEMRLLKSSKRPLTLEELGMSSKAISIVGEEIHKPHGMVLVTGPTGHGKTTTLYAILHILNTPKVNITTIEDPIEYEVGRINQTQVNVKTGVTFANGLRALLRQNPDIIMIGEIRDNDTVEIALQAALTGHLVLSSLHTNDAPSVLPRLLDMGAENFLLSSTINTVIAQRLVRKICPSCIVSYTTPPTAKKMISEQLKLSNRPEKAPSMLCKGKGCALCGNSGFLGQIGIFEVLEIDDSIRKLLLTTSDSTEIRRQAVGAGMITMFEDGLEKVEKGITTVEEVLRVVKE